MTGVNPRAKEIAARLNKKMGEGTVVPGDAVLTFERIPSGSLGLDVILGGGWPTNQAHEIVGENSAGKALDVLTPIPTPTGWSTMKALQVGDQVFDETGRPCNVTFVTEEQHGRTCFLVEFSDGTSLVADADHQWAVTETTAGGRRRSRVLTTADMLQEGIRNYARRRYNFHVAVAGPLQFSGVQDLPVPPYSLGAWLGDGATNAAQITSADEDVLGYIEEDGFRVTKHLNDRGQNPYGYGILGLKALLRKEGLLGCKRIPEAYQQAPVKDRIALLQGLMDTDGYVSARGFCEFSVISRSLAEDVYRLAIGLGHKVAWSEGRAILAGTDHGPRYRVTFYSSLRVARLGRKAQRLRAGTRSARERAVTGITEMPSVPVKCIQVDSPNSLYLAGEACIPTHNTNLVFATFAANMRRDPDWTAVFVASESFNPNYAKMCGVDLDRLLVVNTHIMEEAYEATLQFVESQAVDGIAIDSLPMLVPGQEDEKAMDEMTVGRGALLTGKFFRKVGEASKRSLTEHERPCTLWVINQYRMKIGVMHGDPRTTPGGEAKNYAYFTRVEVKRDEWLETGVGNSKERVGQVVRAKTIKNKSAPPQQEARYDIYFADGGPVPAGQIDYAKEIVTLAILFGLIKRAGAWYSYGNEGDPLYHRWQGKDAIFASVHEEVDLYAALEREVLQVARGA